MYSVIMKIGERIDVFRMNATWSESIWIKNGWYAELKDGIYDNSPYGRNMVSDGKELSFVPHQNIESHIVKNAMVKVATLVITKLK